MVAEHSGARSHRHVLRIALDLGSSGDGLFSAGLAHLFFCESRLEPARQLETRRRRAHARRGPDVPFAVAVRTRAVRSRAIGVRVCNAFGDRLDLPFRQPDVPEPRFAGGEEESVSAEKMTVEYSFEISAMKC